MQHQLIMIQSTGRDGQFRKAHRFRTVFRSILTLSIRDRESVGFNLHKARRTCRGEFVAETKCIGMEVGHGKALD
jgi:hypothetical protein